MNRRDARICRLSRLFVLLADRDEYMSRDVERRMEATSASRSELSELDALSVIAASDRDRLCASALRRLRTRSDGPLIDVLGWLDDGCVAALALALPADRRRAIIERDIVWARAWRSIDHEAVAEFEQFTHDLEIDLSQAMRNLRASGGDPEAHRDEHRRRVVSSGAI